MIVSMSQQTVLFLMTVGAGMVMGFLYDIFRIIRKTIPHNNAVIQLEDLTYWLCISLMMFYFMLHETYGEIRFFALLGAAVGMVLYFVTASVLIIKVSVTVINFFKKVLFAALRILLTPLRLLLKILRRPLRALARLLRKQLHSIKIYAKMKMRNAWKEASVIRKKI